jgi:polyphosphate kinase
VKGRFYLSNILHLLFPSNLAEIYLVASEPEVSVRQDLDLEAPYMEMHQMIGETLVKGKKGDRARFDMLKEEQRAKFQEEDMQELIRKLTPLGVDVQIAPFNFVKGKDGNVKYVEVADAFNDRGKLYDPVALREAIEALPEEEKIRALGYLDRLEALHDLYEKEKKEE